MGLTNFPDGIETSVLSLAGTALLGGTLDTAALKLSGTLVNADAAELNTLDGQTMKFRAGTAVTVSPFSAGTVPTGLGTVLYAVGNLAVAGTGASHVTTGSIAAGGTVIFNVYGTVAAAATVAGTIHWIAAGT